MTAVDEDKILSSNPCRIRGAGDEQAPERPVLTVAQVFELAERVGRRPLGNVRQVPENRYRLRFQRHGEMRTSPEVYGSRAEAIQALWKMAGMAVRTVVTTRDTGRWYCSRRSPAYVGVR